MDSTDYFACYFSHSWSAEQITINLMLWERLATRCRLLIDRPQPTQESDRPYFVSRIESLLRRSDLFVACLPALPPKKRALPRPQATGDWRYTQCSPYILFELRLAERVDVPRFVLYDRESRFQAPASTAHARYVGRRFDELRKLIESGGEDRPLFEEFDQWVAWVDRNRTPEAEPQLGRCGYLLAPDASGTEIRGVALEAVAQAGYDTPLALDSICDTDAALFHALRTLDLLVVDVGRPELLPLYYAAHALLVPTIRLRSDVTDAKSTDDTHLPALLRGHPAGYQLDLVGPAPHDAIFQRILDRASAIVRDVEPVVGMERGRFLLHQRTYPAHYVFISHNQRPDNRGIVDEILAECGRRGITAWEYVNENKSAEHWPTKMKDALKMTTHMIALLSPTYEMSGGCMDEWNYAMEHGVAILPFLVNGRTTASIDLRVKELSHSLLTQSPEANAHKVVDEFRKHLLAPAPGQP